jgi:hypothetical protein
MLPVERMFQDIAEVVQTPVRVANVQDITRCNSAVAFNKSIDEGKRYEVEK